MLWGIMTAPRGGEGGTGGGREGGREGGRVSGRGPGGVQVDVVGHDDRAWGRRGREGKRRE
jgi:hypothetical protein